MVASETRQKSKKHENSRKYNKIETKKQSHPPAIPNKEEISFDFILKMFLLVGGTNANKNFQKNDIKCNI